MTEKRHRTGENSGKNAEKTAVRVARRCVRLRQGGEAALCVLDTGDAPERERDSLTSMGAGVVLSSTAVRLGASSTAGFSTISSTRYRLEVSVGTPLIMP